MQCPPCKKTLEKGSNAGELRGIVIKRTFKTQARWVLVVTTYRKFSNIRHFQKIVAPNFSWFLIGSRIMSPRPIFYLKPILKFLYDLYIEVENFCLTLIVYEIPQKIVSPKRLFLE